MEIEGNAKKFLTIEEANKLISDLEQPLHRLKELNKALDLLRSVTLEFDDEHHNLLNAVKLNQQFHTLSAEFYTLLMNLFSRGCIIKDVETGLVDFYSIHDEKTICLCWQLGEKNIQYWHETDAGAQGRKPINLLRQRME